MSIPKEILESYRISLHHLWPFTALHLAIRLAVVAIVVPLGSALLAAAIATSAHGAVTDQDIARFLLTPPGFAAALAVVSLFLAGAVLDVAVMTAALRSETHTARGALLLAFRVVLDRLLPLLSFAALFVLRVLLLATPFLAVAAGTTLLMLGRYDINYYLTYQPPAFLIAIGLIGVVTAVMAMIFLRRLSSWAVALHLLMFQRIPPHKTFRDSTVRLEGWKQYTVALIFGWVLARWLLASGATAAAGVVIGSVPGLLSTNLRVVAAATIATVLLWIFVSTMIAALSNGALAVLLNRLYSRVTSDDPAIIPLGQTSARRAPMPLAALLVAAAAALGSGAVLGERLLDLVAAESKIEIIAHRGAAAARPENTLAAITRAVEDDADWVEIDVQETADGQVVVAHDSDFMKLAGINLKVRDATLEDLARIDIGSWFDPAFSDERTPTLSEALQVVKGRGKVLIELKYYGDNDDLEARVAAIVGKAGMADNVAVMSLQYAGVQKMRQLRPDWRYGVIAATAIGDLTTLDVDFLAVNAGQASLDLVRRAHARGKEIYVWTVDDPVTMSRMISIGADGLITNRPALAREVMATRNALSTAERLSLWLTDRFRIGSFDLVAPESDA